MEAGWNAIKHGARHGGRQLIRSRRMNYRQVGKVRYISTKSKVKPVKVNARKVHSVAKRVEKVRVEKQRPLSEKDLRLIRESVKHSKETLMEQFAREAEQELLNGFKAKKGEPIIVRMGSKPQIVGRKGGLTPKDLRDLQKILEKVGPETTKKIEALYRQEAQKNGDEDTVGKLRRVADRLVDETFRETLKGVLQEAPKEATHSEDLAYKAANLHSYAFREHHPRDFTVAQSAEIFNLFCSLGDHDSAIKVWDQDSRLHKSVQIRERLANALLRKKVPDYKRAAEESRRIEKVEPNNPEAAYIRGYALEHTGFLSLAAEEYAVAFERGDNAHHGLAHLLSLQRLGQHDEAKEVARLLKSLYVLDGGRDGGNHTTVLANYCGAIIRGRAEKLDDLREQLLAVDDETWEITESVRKLKLLNRGLRDAQPHLEETLRVLQHRLDRVELERLSPEKVAEMASDEARARLNLDPIGGKLRVNSLSYRGGVPYHVSGSFPYGAIPQHAVNREDWRQVKAFMSQPIRKLLHTNRLTQNQAHWLTRHGIDIEKPLIALRDHDEYLVVSTLVIRQLFRTDQLNLENPKSEGHALFDEHAKAKLTEARELEKIIGRAPDVRTNISAAIEERHGDCRQHAWTAQLMWDVRQRHQARVHMRKYREAMAEGNTKLAKKQLKKLERESRLEMRTFDVGIHSKMQVEEPFKAKTDKSGLPLKSEKLEMFENFHQMPMVLEYDKEGQVRQLWFRDPFYRGDHYWDLGTGKVSREKLKAFLEGDMLPTPNLATVVDPKSGEKVKVEVFLKPSEFSLQPRPKRDVDPVETKTRSYGREKKVELSTLSAETMRKQDQEFLAQLRKGIAQDEKVSSTIRRQQ